MKKNTWLLLTSVAACGGLLFACGDSAGTGGSGGTVVSVTNSHTVAGPAPAAQTSTGAGGAPAVPTPGQQIDRMGRPAIDTATNETFLAVNGTPTVSTDALRGAAEDAYNADGDPTHWATYKATMAQQLAILDALDAADPAGCGNQGPCTGTTAGCYDQLATILTADMLWLSTGTTATCTTYLGLEQKALGVAIDDCGGRRPADDVIQTTYTLVSGVAFDDGITDPGNHQNTFPYFAAPH